MSGTGIGSRFADLRLPTGAALMGLVDHRRRILHPFLFLAEIHSGPTVHIILDFSDADSYFQPAGKTTMFTGWHMLPIVVSGCLNLFAESQKQLSRA
jgi:hypothetical protein